MNNDPQVPWLWAALILVALFAVGGFIAWAVAEWIL